MAKFKTKMYNKVFLRKGKDSSNKFLNSQSKQIPNSDYFTNIVPPINQTSDSHSEINHEEQEKSQNNSKMQVTSSYVIPLKDENNQESKPYESKNEKTTALTIQARPTDTMALIDLKNNFKIPKPISLEIKIEKLKQLLLCFFSFVVMMIGSLFITFYFTNFHIRYIPHPVLTIPLVILALTVLLVNLIDFFSLKKEINLYIEKTLKGSLVPPNFMIQNYRKIHARKIIVRWLSIFLYISLGLVTMVLFLISGQKLTFLVQSWTVNVPNLKKDAITLTIVIGIIFFIHMMTIVFFHKRKNNIISYYGYEIISPSEMEIYQKKINRICLIIVVAFLCIIFFLIAIPILVLRRRKRRG